MTKFTRRKQRSEVKQEIDNFYQMIDRETKQEHVYQTTYLAKAIILVAKALMVKGD